ncbi:MAG: bifunctional diaminohydroxyphosphoribosylaminopyrimidine deaminase/5-amino-6-(5-phosphoribosylamino)uracil reductase RibD [Luminiphilus sp.]|jgi:diaminohydroxyphosphoribosylaminopyrimidine deaminase/5-amino-6-(5-phosphoribosylamino)uracil reductase
MSRERDRVLMEHAIEIGRHGRFWSAPNPAVGCVLAHQDTIVATGFTQPAGQPHAEIMALQGVDDARGMTAYVTLEPCSHHGRTPPCIGALIEAGVSRVVVGLEDPNPDVSGRGIAALREAGVTVEVGLLGDRVSVDLQGFLLRMRRGWGRITLKVAASLDGRTAMASGESQWITGAAARRDVQLWRAQSDAIVTGVETVIADDCRLTLRADDLSLEEGDKARALAHPPTRMVLDSRGRTPANAAVLQGAPTVVVTTGATDFSTSVQVASDPAGRIVLEDWIRVLGEAQYNEILVEAGPTLSGALIREGWVDRVLLYQAPKFLGAFARPIGAFEVEQLSAAPGFVFQDVTRIGEDLRIIATRARSGSE